MRKSNLVGQRFGKLVVIKEAERRNKNTAWHCLCDCGKETISLSYNLTAGKSKSCGCVRGEKMGRRMLTHGHSKTRLYTIYKGMRQRCLNKNTPSYKYYGGKGVEIFDEWKNDFNTFFLWANENGYLDGLTIDRIDPNGNYCPSNCRWETPLKQQNNKLNSIFLIIDGEKKTIAEWAIGLHTNKQTLYSKFYRLIDQLGLCDNKMISFEIKTELSKTNPILF